MPPSLARPLLLVAGLALCGPAARAEPGLRGSLFVDTGARRALWDAPGRHPDSAAPPVRRAALAAPMAHPAAPPSGGDPRARLRALIASAEAGKAGYDAVQHGARRKPPAPPTRMTIGQILDWIARTPGQPHAIGRYQFIPPTLRLLVKRAGFTRETRFSPAVQDSLADLLLMDAGLARFETGRLDPHCFMDNLARIWAGLPTRSGRSHYHGVAGNRATISRASFERELRAIYR
ncbi:hypothetical protein [Limimaricola cinnabarinus]|uniref:hypothetical protein n=1 Tax=Limimaricola cinnabarinus TaxID=1125964 RepID=UPI00248FF7EC|nr:hypothetical protein [Limimaricola cinnabarinus]